MWARAKAHLNLLALKGMHNGILEGCLVRDQDEHVVIDVVVALQVMAGRQGNQRVDSKCFLRDTRMGHGGMGRRLRHKETAKDN